MLQLKQIRHITIIAQGVPGRYTRHLAQLAKETNVVILDPSTADGLKLESFRIGNTGGMLDNIVSSKLFRPGSGGLSIELSNMLSFLHTAFFCLSGFHLSCVVTLWKVLEFSVFLFENKLNQTCQQNISLCRLCLARNCNRW